jgi:hypothetical protein
MKIVVLDIDVNTGLGVGHLAFWSLAHIDGGTNNGREDGVMQYGLMRPLACSLGRWYHALQRQERVRAV